MFQNSKKYFLTKIRYQKSGREKMKNNGKRQQVMDRKKIYNLQIKIIGCQNKRCAEKTSRSQTQKRKVKLILSVLNSFERAFVNQFFNQTVLNQRKMHKQQPFSVIHNYRTLINEIITPQRKQSQSKSLTKRKKITKKGKKQSAKRKDSKEEKQEDKVQTTHKNKKDSVEEKEESVRQEGGWEKPQWEGSEKGGSMELDEIIPYYGSENELNMENCLMEGERKFSVVEEFLLQDESQN